MVGVKEMGSKSYEQLVGKSPTDLAYALTRLIEVGTLRLLSARAIRLENSGNTAVIVSNDGYFIVQSALNDIEKYFRNIFLYDKIEDQIPATPTETNATGSKTTSTAKKADVHPDVTLFTETAEKEQPKLVVVESPKTTKRTETKSADISLEDLIRNGMV